ncbi:MAG: chloride channel protein [Burkholderiaceae bacterium]
MNLPDRPPHEAPDVIASVRGDLADWRAWWSRGVILVYAAAAGLSVVAFIRLSELALSGFSTLYKDHPWAPLVWTPALCAAMAWVMVRHFPGTTGSGIPQVMAALHTSVDDRTRPRLVSLRLSLAKLLLTAGGLLAGLPIGREGPSVQIAAGVMQHARKWLPERFSVTPHGLLVAGGSAGIAAAFNAPLAGITFAIEELTSKMEQRSSGLVISAIVLSGLVAISAFGNATYFGVIRVAQLGAAFLWPAMLVVAGSGLLGGLFSRLLQASLIAQPGRIGRWRRRHPIAFAAICGLAIATIGLASGGSTFGSGYDYTRRLLEGRTDLPVLYVTLRIVATWLATWSGLPGGLFAPSLAIGAGIGNDVALLTGWAAQSPALIALGMAGFLAAVTQAPVTSFIIVMEMVDGHAMVLSLMASALCASLVARWLAHPLYSALASAQLVRVRAQE